MQEVSPARVSMCKLIALSLSFCVCGNKGKMCDSLQYCFTRYQVLAHGLFRMVLLDHKTHFSLQGISPVFIKPL